MTTTPKTTNLTKLPLNRALLQMGLPAAGAMLIESLYYLVDAFWVGKLGAISFAAISATSFLLWLLGSLADLTGIAANTLTARAVGSQRDDLVQRYIRQCLLVAVLLSISLALIAFPLRRLLLIWIGLEPDVVEEGVAYLVPMLFGMPTLFLVLPISGAMRGTGDARTPMMLMGLMVLLNAFIDPLLIFGLGPIPAMGVAGAAWATVICHAIGFGIGIIILRNRSLLPPLFSINSFKPHMPDILSIFRIGLPISLNAAFFSLIYLGLTAIISRFGSGAVAAIGMGHRIEAFPYFLSYGFSIAAAALVGQYLGASRPEDAAKALWKSCAMAFIPIAAYVLLILLAAEPIVRFFIDDQEIVGESAVYLRIVAVCWLIGFMEIVVEGGFVGAGNTLPPLIIGTTFTLLRIPAAFVFAIVLDFGPSAVWWTIGISSVLKGLLLTLWFKLGYWKKHTGIA